LNYLTELKTISAGVFRYIKVTKKAEILNNIPINRKSTAFSGKEQNSLF